MINEKMQSYFLAIVSLLVSICFIYGAITFEKSYPKYNDLLFSEGELIERTTGNRHAFYFSLSGNEGKFQYHSKAGKMITVRDLVNSGSIAKVGYTLEGRSRKSVYDLEIDGRKVRSYEEIRASYISDNRWIFLLVPLMILCFVFLFWNAKRQ